MHANTEFLLPALHALSGRLRLFFAQTTDQGLQANTQSSPSFEVQLEQTPLPVETGNDSNPLSTWNVTPTPPEDDGVTVSMLNGKSRLKIFGSLSALSVFSTDRHLLLECPCSCCRHRLLVSIRTRSISTAGNPILGQLSSVQRPMVSLHRRHLFRSLQMIRSRVTATDSCHTTRLANEE